MDGPLWDMGLRGALGGICRRGQRGQNAQDRCGFRMILKPHSVARHRGGNRLSPPNLSVTGGRRPAVESLLSMNQTLPPIM
jgi:hypothetical protein